MGLMWSYFSGAIIVTDSDVNLAFGSFASHGVLLRADSKIIANDLWLECKPLEIDSGKIGQFDQETSCHAPNLNASETTSGRLCVLDVNWFQTFFAL